MSLLFFESFDGGDYSLPGRWLGPTGIPTSTGGIHGNYVPVNQGANSSFRIAAVAEDDLIVVGAHVFDILAITADDGFANGGIFKLTSDGGLTFHITLARNPATDALVVRRGGPTGTILGSTAAGVFPANGWKHVALKVLLHDTVGTVDVEVGGVNELSLTSQDTKNGGTDATFDTVEIHGPHNGGTNCRRFDDFYVCNGVDSGIVGLPNNDFLGPCRASVLLPVADSIPEQWTPSTGTDTTALIDEATPNGDTDYISDDTVANKSQVTLADLTDLDSTVFGVQMSAQARQDDAGEARFRQGIHSDLTDGNGADHLLTESYLIYLDMFEADPDGGVAWTPAQVNAAEVFVETRT